MVVENKQFAGNDFSKEALDKGEYENCSFLNCNFSGLTLAGIIFLECEFTDCDFSMAKLANASFRDVKFIRCKQLGLRFDQCNPLLLSFFFEGCILNFSSFYKLKIKETVFRDCHLQEVEFAEADLSNVVFDRCDMTRSTFENTLLTGVDFRTAFNFSIDPERNRMKNARFSFENVQGLLDKYGVIVG